MFDLINRQSVLNLAKDLVFTYEDGGEYRCRCIMPDAVRGLPSVTMRGYDLNDLMVFALLCREAGITPKDLKSFCLDVGHAIDTALEINKREMDRIVKETLEGYK